MKWLQIHWNSWQWSGYRHCIWRNTQKKPTLFTAADTKPRNNSGILTDMTFITAVLPTLGPNTSLSLVKKNQTQPVKALNETKHNASSYRLSSQEVKCQLRMHHRLALSIRWPVFRCPWTLSSPHPLRMHWLNLIRELVSCMGWENSVPFEMDTHMHTTCVSLSKTSNPQGSLPPGAE